MTGKERKPMDWKEWQGNRNAGRGWTEERECRRVAESLTLAGELSRLDLHLRPLPCGNAGREPERD